MPEHAIWEYMGPIATADQIKFTEEKDCVSESQMFREECGYTYCSGTCREDGPMIAFKGSPFDSPVWSATSSMYIFPVLDDLVRDGKADPNAVDHILKCIFEAAGKAQFGDFFSKVGLRGWLGAPESVDDGRLMGAYLEIVLQCLNVSFETEAFNAEEVIYVIDREALANRMNRIVDCYLSLWYGNTKSLVNAQWSLWEENSPEGKLRIKIAKKIDKFC